MGGGGPSSLRFLPGVSLGGGVHFCICIFGRGGGQRNLETPLATPLRWTTRCLIRVDLFFTNSLLTPGGSSQI